MAREDVFTFDQYGLLTQIGSGAVGNPTHITTLAHNFTPLANPVTRADDRRLASITYPDLSSVTIDLPRLRNALITSTAYAVNPILANDPRAFKLDTVGTSNPTLNYAAVTYKRSPNSDPQRTIFQLDHRGRVLRSWDPEQVFALGLATASIGTTQIQTLQAHLDLSSQNTLETTTRDALGRITGRDWGEIRAMLSPDPDKVVVNGIPQSNGPRGRQTSTYNYLNNNPVLRQQPIQTAEWSVWNDTFDALTEAIDETGNKFQQVVDGANGLVTQQRWIHPSPVWQNNNRPMDVNNDQFVSNIDVIIIQNYINVTGGGSAVPANATSAPPFYDVNGDNFVTNLDALLVINVLNGGGELVVPQALLGQIDITYTTAGSSLPKGLVLQEIITTGRSSGNNLVTYGYIFNPSDKARHARLLSVTETDTTPATTSLQYDDRGNVNQVTDPAGRITRMYYDSLDRLTAVVDPDPDGAGPLLPAVKRFDYDVFNNVTAVELVNSRMEGSQLYVTALPTSYEYDNANRVSVEYRQRPSLNWYLYMDAGGNVLRTNVKTTAAANPAVTSAALTNYAAANSRVLNQPNASSARQGLKTEYTYFAPTSPNEVSVKQSDVATANPTLTERTSRLVYDRLNRLTKAVAPPPELGLTPSATDQLDNGGFVTRFGYDNLSNLISETDGLNNTTVYSYDDLNRLTKVARPNPAVGATLDTLIAYSATSTGWVLTQTDPLLNTLVVQTDSLGRPQSLSGTSAPARTLRYWPDGGLQLSKDERANITDFGYDRRGRLLSVTQPSLVANGPRSVTAYQYTVDSLLSSISDPLGRVTSLTYDAGGRNTRATEPDPDGLGPLTAAFANSTLDSLGNVLAKSDALGNNHSFVLDSQFRVFLGTDPAGAVTTLARDSFGNLLSLTDPLNNVTAYGYNKLNQLVTETKTVSGAPLSRAYSYDGAGNLRSMIDRNGRTIEYAYYKLYRPTTETWKTGAVTNRTLNYAYDTADRLLTFDDSDPLATDFQFAYDARSQLQSERQFTGLVNRSVVLDRDFDVDGNRTKLAATFGATLSGTTIVGGQKDFVSNFAYDNMNRLTSVSQTSVTGGNAVSPKAAAFQYNAASQLTDLRRYSAHSPNLANLEVHTRHSYDAAGRLKSITHGKTEIASGENWNGTATLPASLGATNMLAGYYLSYDQGNRVTSLASQFDRFSTTYSYNSTNQLTGSTSLGIAAMAAPSFLPPTETYNLDANGNRRTAAGGSQSAAGTHNRLQTDGTYNYTYDNEGNTTRRTRISSGLITDYTWDHRNRLTSVTERTAAAVATKKTEYIYDAFDQRVAKRFDANGDGTDEIHEAWVWADGQEVSRLLDSDGPATVQPFRVKNRYLYGDAVDMLLADEQYGSNGSNILATAPNGIQGNTLWPLSDHLGSIRDVVDNNGIIRQHLVFDSFGRRLTEVDYSTTGTVIPSTHLAAVDELFAYTGRYWDKDTNLQNNRARWYDPNTGRWLSQDPIGFGGGDANFYRYVRNGPTNATDPSGLRGWEIGGLTPGQWTYATGVLFYEWGANGYRAGRGLITGEAGRHMGNRTVTMSQNQSGNKFDGDAGDWWRFTCKMSQEMIGANSIAEGAVGVDMAEMRELDAWERGTRISSGTGAMAGIAAGGLGLAGKAGVGVGNIRVPYTPNMPSIPIPPWMNPTIRNPFRPKGPSFEGLTPGEIALVRDALHEAGMSKVDIVIIGADMPEGYFGMTLGDSGFAVNRAILGNATELTKTLRHELQHVLDRRALSNPGAYGQCLEDAAEAAEGR